MHGEKIAVKNDTEVTVTARTGALLSSSSCGHPSYHEAAAFMGKVKGFVATRDWQGLSAVATFPLRTPVGPISDAPTFVAKAEAIFTSPIRVAVGYAEPKAVFCNRQGFMIGNGLLWAGAGAGGRVGLTTVNSPSK
jgi:hypothetical protein